MPDDLVARYLLALDAFGRRVHAVRADEWAAPTPAGHWTVADLVAHLTDEQWWVEPLLHGFDLDRAAKTVDELRASAAEGDHAAQWDRAVASAVAAASEVGALGRGVALSRGAATGSDYLHELVFDLTVHAWDLERAIDYPDSLPGSLVAAVWLRVEDVGDLSSTGLFDSAVEVPDDAAVLDRLVAVTGRDPRWRPTVVVPRPPPAEGMA